jgi:excisionase family DNA binding protein
MELIHGYIQLDIAAADPRACETADQDDLPNDLERALNAVENIRAQIKRGCGSKRAKPERVESASPTGLLDAEKAAERLGVPKSWVMREKNAGRLPFVYVGRWVRFRPSDIDSIIANGTEPR